MSMERNCTVLLHYDKNTPPNEDEIREELESKEVRARNRTPPAASNSISRPCGPHRRSLRTAAASPSPGREEDQRSEDADLSHAQRRGDAEAADDGDPVLRDVGQPHDQEADAHLLGGHRQDRPRRQAAARDDPRVQLAPQRPLPRQRVHPRLHAPLPHEAQGAGDPRAAHPDDQEQPRAPPLLCPPQRRPRRLCHLPLVRGAAPRWPPAGGEGAAWRGVAPAPTPTRPARARRAPSTRWLPRRPGQSLGPPRRVVRRHRGQRGASLPRTPPLSPTQPHPSPTPLPSPCVPPTRLLRRRRCSRRRPTCRASATPS